MVNNLVENLFRNIKNVPGKKTNRKIVVIYADDFGSVRTKDRNAYNFLLQKGVPMSNSRFSKYDTLASEEDLTMLFDVLLSVKDINSNPACMTPFVNVANPDFDKIRESHFTEYYREPFIETLKKYGKGYDEAFNLWKWGIDNKLFYPAYHGTEHINVIRFMEALKANHRSVRLSFDVESVCVPNFIDEDPVIRPTTTFYINSSIENELLKEHIIEGLNLFEYLFDFRSKQFTPGAGIYSPKLEPVLYNNGIRYINVGRFKKYPLGEGNYSRKFIYNGLENRSKQKYIIRNCVFEPNGSLDSSIVKKCFKDVEAAFWWGSPAIISTHRVNFIGHFDTNWRNNSLKSLKQLLLLIVQRFPDVEFMNGDQMADIVFD